MVNYVDLIKSFNLYIMKSNKITIDVNKINDEHVDISNDDLIETIGMFDKSFIYTPHPDCYDFFRVSSMSNAWSYTNENNEFIYGGYLFNGILDLFVEESGFWDVYNSINKHEPDEEELEFLKKLNWFEKQAWGDDGKFGCFLREPGDFPPPIYFYDYGALYPMRLTLEEYFNGMIASCGVRGWQYFYLDYSKIEIPDLPKVNKELIVKDLAFIVKMLPALFPDNDFSFHINKLEEIKKIL